MSHHGSGLLLTHPLDTHSRADDKAGDLLVIRQTLEAYILEPLVRWNNRTTKHWTVNIDWQLDRFGGLNEK